MSKKDQENLGHASHYIRQKDYAAARSILEKMNHPTAKQWLAKLDQIAPVKHKRSVGKAEFIGIGLVACIGLAVCLAIGQSVGILPSKTKTVEAENETTNQGTSPALQAMTTPTVTPTPPSTSTATNLPLPTDTPTMTLIAPTLEPTIKPSSTVRPTYQTRYTTANVNVRQGAGTTFERIGSLPEGYQLTVVGELADWYQIEFNNGVGWVAREYTSAHAPSAANDGGGANNNTPIPQATAQPQPAGCNCNGPDLDCSNFSTHAQAQACFNYCMSTVGNDVFRLDGEDNDGLACEALP